MRIIAGLRRGHKFDGPENDDTRPTSDLVREAIFNILGEAVEGLIVVDLFAGTGGLGLEALSRGAERAIFVEKNRANVGLIKRNLATLRFEDRGSVIPGDAYRWAKTLTPTEGEPVVVFLDPPYREFERYPERVLQMLESLSNGLPQGSIIVVESSKGIDADAILPEPDAWDLRKYGGTQVAFRFLGEWPESSEEEDEASEVEFETEQQGESHGYEPPDAD